METRKHVKSAVTYRMIAEALFDNYESIYDIHRDILMQLPFLLVSLSLGQGKLTSGMLASTTPPFIFYFFWLEEREGSWINSLNV